LPVLHGKALAVVVAYDMYLECCEGKLNLEWIKRPHVCHVCGEPAYSKCGLCDVTLHYFSKRGAHAGAECFLQYHSDAFFGLAKSDAIMVKKRKQDWVFPTNSAKQGNAAYIRRIKGNRSADEAAANNRNNA
jgi:hypothetical protein